LFQHIFDRFLLEPLLFPFFYLCRCPGRNPQVASSFRELHKKKGRRSRYTRCPISTSQLYNSPDDVACGCITSRLHLSGPSLGGVTSRFFSYITHLLGCFRLYNWWRCRSGLDVGRIKSGNPEPITSASRATGQWLLFPCKVIRSILDKVVVPNRFQADGLSNGTLMVQM